MNERKIKQYLRVHVFVDLDFIPQIVQEPIFEEYYSLMVPMIPEMKKLLEARQKGRPEKDEALEIKNQAIESSEQLTFGRVKQFLDRNETDLAVLAENLHRDGHAGEILRAAIRGEELDENISLAQITHAATFLMGNLEGHFSEETKKDPILSGALEHFYRVSRGYAFDEGRYQRVPSILNALRKSREFLKIAELVADEGKTTLSGLIDGTSQLLWQRGMEALNEFCHERKLPTLNLSQPPKLAG